MLQGSVRAVLWVNITIKTHQYKNVIDNVTSPSDV